MKKNKVKKEQLGKAFFILSQCKKITYYKNVKKVTDL